MKKYRTLLISLGNMGRNHYKTLAHSDQFDLTAVLEPNREHKNWQLVAEKIKRYYSLEEISSSDFDLALVASPTETHYMVGKDLLERGLSILMEKPLAATANQASELVRTANVKNLELVVGQVERCNNVIVLARKILDSRVLGEIVSVNSKRGGAYPAMVKRGNNVILDLAIHDLDLMRETFGEIELLGAQGKCVRDSEIVDCAGIQLKTSSGVSLGVNANWFSPHRLREWEIIGSESFLMIDFLTQSCRLTGKDLTAKLEELDLPPSTNNSNDYFDDYSFAADTKPPLERQLDEWHKHLAGQSSIMATGAEALEMIRICEQADKIIRNS